MCGLACILQRGNHLERIRKQLDRIDILQAARGPDDRGNFLEHFPELNLSLGFTHQRLSVLDLSPAGHQPLHSQDGRYVLIYNGEVYNFKELASQLQNEPEMQGSSGDSAVVLSALIRWGPQALARFNGMWAIIFLDRIRKTLLISRDRFGMKPLYFYRDQQQLIFASTIKSILETTAQKFALEPDIIARYLFQSLTDSDQRTFFCGIESFPAAHCAEISIAQPSFSFATQSYWQHPIARGEKTIALTPDTPSQLRESLLSSVNRHLQSDVPVGLLLSGGLDSSSIFAAALSDSHCSLTTITAQSLDPAYDESPYVQACLNKFSQRGEQVIIDSQPLTLLDDLPEVCWDHEAPIASLSVVAHKRLIARAKELGLKVLLTGQGADEQLAGYNKFLYFYLFDCLKKGAWPQALQMLLSSLFRRTIIAEFKLAEAKRYIPWIRGRVGALYRSDFLQGARLASSGPASSYQERELMDLQQLSLPMILHYEDSMSMSQSCEMRVPFLDLELVEFLGKLSPHAKLRHGYSKYILRQAVSEWLPNSIVWRRDKNGFSLPENSWARAAFGERINAVLHPGARVVSHGIVDAQGMAQLISLFRRGSKQIGFKDIFNLYCLETWLGRFERWIR